MERCNKAASDETGPASDGIRGSSAIIRDFAFDLEKHCTVFTQGYELPYNPVSFFYTVAMCGAWHPVAHTTFSSHWNEQGIARFRVGIDMASQYISNAVKLAMVPIATNLQLRCRELEGLMAVASADGIYWKDGHSKHAGAVSALRRSSELLLYKLDDLSSETDKAHDRLKLFLQVRMHLNTLTTFNRCCALVRQRVPRCLLCLPSCCSIPGCANNVRAPCLRPQHNCLML